jgi:cytochrome c oxidase subunit 1/cytochrome c oxidase subunit I+III
MPRRVYTYDSGLGWSGLNLVISIASFAFGLGTLLTLVNFVKSHRRGAPAPDNPWDADTLEWSTSSPPPEYNFASTPVVSSLHPLWDEEPVPAAVAGSGAAPAEVGHALGVGGALDKEMPVTEGLDALPQDTLGIPEPTYLPFLAALGVTAIFVGLLAEAVVVGVAGAVVGIAAVVVWLWRTDEDLR